MGGCFGRERVDASTQTPTRPPESEYFSEDLLSESEEDWRPPEPFGPPPDWFEDLVAYHWWHEQWHSWAQRGQDPGPQPPPPTYPPPGAGGRAASSSEAFGE